MIIPIDKEDKKTASKSAIKKRELEDCEPGATRDEVLQFIEKVATSPKSYQKRAQPPVPTSK